MNSMSTIHPDVIGRLRTFFTTYLSTVRELNLDTSAAKRRQLPEFFLTLPTEGGTQAVTLRGLLPSGEVYAPLNTRLREQVKSLSDGRLRVILHPAEEREAMYQTFGQGGVTRYLHPDAMQALADLKLTWDGYGLLSGVLGWSALLAVVLGLFVLWGVDTLLVTVLAMLFWCAVVGVAYFLLSRLLVVPAIQRPLAARRRAGFARILADCQEVERRQLSPLMAAEIPPSVMDALARLPGERPQAQGVLERGEWWQAELWDLAHEAAQSLAKTPESSPDFPRLTHDTASLVGRVVQVFGLVQGSDPAAAQRLTEVCAQIEQQAAILGLNVPPLPAAFPVTATSLPAQPMMAHSVLDDPQVPAPNRLIAAQPQQPRLDPPLNLKETPHD